MSVFDELANPWVCGLPTYEPGRPIEEVARELGFGSAAGIVKLASNENALGPSPRALAAIQGCASRMHLYPDGGAFYLKRALSEKLGVDSEQILVGNGSNEMLEFLGHVFLCPCKAVVAADRAFIVYKLIAAASRADMISVPMVAFTHDLDAMLAAVTSETAILFVANPNNPTGTMVGQGAIDEFMSSVPDHVIVCFDEAYIELLPPGQQPDTLRYVRDGRNVVVLRTFSKTHGLAGLRIGYAVAPENCIQLLNRVRQPFNTNAMALAAAEAAVGDDEHVERTRTLVKEGLEFFERELTRLGIAWVPSVANFILVEVGKGRECFASLQQKGVIVRPMDVYGLPDHIRITIGKQEENEKCIAAIEEIRRQGDGEAGK